MFSVGGGGGYNFVFRGEGLRDNCVFRGRLIFDNFTICEFKEFQYFKGDPAPSRSAHAAPTTINLKYHVHIYLYLHQKILQLLFIDM